MFSVFSFAAILHFAMTLSMKICAMEESYCSPLSDRMRAVIWVFPHREAAMSFPSPARDTASWARRFVFLLWQNQLPGGRSKYVVKLIDKINNEITHKFFQFRFEFFIFSVSSLQHVTKMVIFFIHIIGEEITSSLDDIRVETAIYVRLLTTINKAYQVILSIRSIPKLCNKTNEIDSPKLLYHFIHLLVIHCNYF